MSSRSITYHLVRRVSILRDVHFYYCILKDGTASTTENPKMAMRWMNPEAAQQFAHYLGLWWCAVEMTFPGDELCMLQPHLHVN